jgi:hypothetical protein
MSRASVAKMDVFFVDVLVSFEYVYNTLILDFGGLQ